MTTPASSSVRTLAVQSAAWYGATRLWGQLVSWAVTILLARMLVPHDYGLFAIALSILALLELLQEFGLGTALIQRQNLRGQQVNAVFWVVASASLLLTAATFVASGTISRMYGEPSLAWPLRLLCLTFLLNSVGTVPYSLLTKAINLRQRSLAEALGATTAALVALALAYLGYGVGALVIGHLCRAVVLNLLLFVFARWAPGLDVDFTQMRDLLTYGMRIAGTHLVSTGNVAAITFIVARQLGGTAVGLYAMAQSLTDAPNRLSTAIINQISLPVFSKLQHDQALLAAYFLKISKYLAVVSLPLQIGLALVAPALIPLLLSATWQALTLPFQIFCLGSVVVLCTLTCSPLLMARNRASFLFNLSLVAFVTVTGGTLLGAHFGLVAVILARFIAIVPLRVIMLLATLRELEVSPTLYLRSLAAPFGAVVPMIAAVELVQVAGLPNGNRLECLALSIAVGAITYLMALFLLDRTIGSELRTGLRDLFSASKAQEGVF
jgi:O-antigen/teichoic acid export membrane protein